MKLALVNYKTIGTVAFSEDVAKEYIFRHFNIIDSIELVMFSECKYARRLQYLLVVHYKDGRKIAYPRTKGLNIVVAKFDDIQSISEIPYKRFLTEDDIK